MYSFSNLEPVCCSMFSSSCCFLTCVKISQEAGNVVWYSHLFTNFQQFVVIHTVKGFGILNKAKVDVFLERSHFFNDSVDIGNLISCSSAFSKTSLNIRKFTVHILLKPGLENFEHYFASVWDGYNCAVVWTILSLPTGLIQASQRKCVEIRTGQSAFLLGRLPMTAALEDPVRALAPLPRGDRKSVV